MSSRNLEISTQETYIKDHETPAYDLALLALAQNGFNLDSMYRQVTDNGSSIREGIFYLYTSGTNQSQEVFNRLQQTPEFGVVRNLFTRTEFAYLPGAIYRTDEYGGDYSDRPVHFYRYLEACSWNDFLKCRVISRYWENEAENWRYKDQKDKDVAFGAFMFETGAAEGYNPLHRTGLAIASVFSPFGIIGLIASKFDKELIQSSQVCAQLAKVIRKPFDRLTDTEIPDLLHPVVERISAPLES